AATAPSAAAAAASAKARRGDMPRILGALDRAHARGLEAAGPHAALDLGVDGLDHLHAGVALGVPLDQVPRRVLGVGALQHVLQRPDVMLSLLAVAPVLVGELPPLQRVLLAALEALELLGVGDVQPELDDDHP